MKRFLAALLLPFLFLLPASATDWSDTARLVARSIVHIRGDKGSCTGFVIDTKRDYVLTAAHCDEPKMTVDHLVTHVILKDTKHDLMVLMVPALQKPALRVAATDPAVGTEAATYGYGGGMSRPIFRAVHVSDNALNMPGAPVKKYIATDAGFLLGHSGSPIVNINGDVVALVQMSSDVNIGIGLGAEALRARVGPYMEQK